jgi:hypothetical protein
MPRRRQLRNNAVMSIEFGMPRGRRGEEEAGPRDDAVTVLVQMYRCPSGHVSDIVWTAPEMAIVREAHDLRFYCARCRRSRFASDAEARSLLAAFGLAPALRIYAS